MHRVNSRLMRMFIGPRWRCCRCGGVDDSQCLSQLTHSTTCYVSYYIRSSCTQSYQHNTHIVSLIITVQVLDLPLSIFFNDFLPMYRYIDTHTCRDTHACKRRHTVSEPSSLDLLTGLWLMWHILSPCSDAQRWATMVGIAHTHTSYMCTFFKHTRLTHAHTDTHIKHGSGDLCLADFNHARWPLDDEWQAAPLSHSLSSLFLLPPPFSFHFQESQFVFYPAEGEY